MAGLVVCALAVGFLAGKIWPSGKATHNGPSTQEELVRMPDGAKPLKPGPWGNLEYLPIYIEPPEEYLPTKVLEEADARWCFRGFTPGRLTSLFQTADLTVAQSTELLDTSKWQQDAEAIYVMPSDDLLLSLSSEARRHIYTTMDTAPNNLLGMVRCSYPPDQFDATLSQSGLPVETIALIKKLSYPHGKLVFFCDLPLVLKTLKTPEQKTRLCKTLFRKSTLLLRLHVTPDTDVNALAHYWIRAGWGLDLRPLLDSLTKVPQGARIDIVELLPPLPSAEIYTFPFPSTKPEDEHKDCHWTAMNFFRDTPDQRFTNPEIVTQTLRTDYYPVLWDPRYGDILVLYKPNGDAIHSCVFIADNIVFTKNSANFRDPFIFMTIPDMIDHFEALLPEDQKLSLQYFRNKYY